jgi:Short C-terminal domain
MAIESVGPSDEAEPGPPAQPGVPPAPLVSPDELWEGAPSVLYDGGRYTIGWQGRPENRGGPVFVTVRRTALDGRKVVERYPMTDKGWSLAWRDLARLDPAAPAPVLAVLAGRIERQRVLAARRDLDARSLASVSKAIFMGGYLAGADFAAGQSYELRFLEESLSVLAEGGIEALADFGYTAVEAVEVDGPGRVDRWSIGQQALITGAFGLAGALAAYAGARIKTFVRVQTADGELFFLHTTLPPDELRVRLSRGISAVREARASFAGTGDGAGQSGARSLVDELSRLAGLLDRGLLTREEFDQLKTRLIAGQ